MSFDSVGGGYLGGRDYDDWSDEEQQDCYNDSPDRDDIGDYLTLYDLYYYVLTKQDYYEEKVVHNFGRNPYERYVQIYLPDLEYALSRQEPEENARKRQLRRMKKLKEELLAVTLHPNRISHCGLGELFGNS